MRKKPETNVGVWMDHHRAVIVTLNGFEVRIKTIERVVERKHRSTGGVRSRRSYIYRSFSSDLEEHRRTEIERFFAALLKEIRGVRMLTIIGPSNGKDDFARYLKRFEPKCAVYLAAASSRLSEAQIIAQFRELFGKPLPRSRGVA